MIPGPSVASFAKPRLIVRRRPTPSQGRGLEALGHAIEYLIDSSRNTAAMESGSDATQAARILMNLSRELFAECREIVPLRDRVVECLTRMFGRPALILPPTRMVGFEADTLPRQWL